MVDDRLSASLQQAVLAALCFDEKHGSAIAAQVIPEYFDSVYRDFASRVLVYRRKYGRAPGENYLHDLADQVSFGRKNTLVRDRLIPQLIAEADEINAEYIASRTEEFVRRQVLKTALFEASDRYDQDDEKMVGDVERILHRALQFRSQTMDAGVFLNEARALSFVEQNTTDFISLGIPELDRLKIGLSPKEMLLYIAPKGSGKTWFCVNAGKQALLQRKRVLHVSLEMDELKNIRRYYQSLFGAARSPERFNRTVLEFDDLNRVIGFKTKKAKPALDLSEPRIRKILRAKMDRFGTRLGGLAVKQFATGTLTLEQLVSYLDYLEAVHKFVPHVLIVDYPDLMSVDRRNYRLEIGYNFEGLRGIGVQRNMAVVAPTQGARSTIGAKYVQSRDAAEDIRKVNAADVVMTFSATKEEKRLGLGRLSVEHARDSESDTLILLSQSYHTGQYVLSSAVMQAAYWDRLREVTGDEGEE